MNLHRVHIVTLPPFDLFRRRIDVLPSGATSLSYPSPPSPQLLPRFTFFLPFQSALPDTACDRNSLNNSVLSGYSTRTSV